MFLSGETLAQELGVSRTAIWKSNQRIRKKRGIRFNIPRTVYRYQASDILDAKEIHEGIHQDVDITVLETSTSTMKRCSAGCDGW